MPLINRYIILIKKQFHLYFFKKNAGFYYTETSDVSNRLSKLLKVSEENIFSIGNTYSHVFDKPIIEYNLLPARRNNEFRLITISSENPHKNLNIIKSIIPILNESGLNVVFILTLPDKLFNREFKEYKEHIINLGPVPLSYCPYLYSNSDAVFLPTLVECFSASYPEAMKMKKPILTSDLSFAHTVCGDAAEYFNPLDAQDIAKKIMNLATDRKRQAELVLKGENRLSYFEKPYSRAKKIIEVCKNICSSK